MIAELIPEAYDIFGKPSSAPISRKQKRAFTPSFPIGRFLTQHLSHQCSDFSDLGRFLKTCKYVSDQEQFGQKDFWQPPEEFEKTRQGDCDDFALWTWRQLISMGYRARFVVGWAGRYGRGHAWVTIEKDNKHFLVEPVARFLGEKLPRLSTLRYEPYGSVEWNGERIRYFVHEKRLYDPPLREVIPLIPEWVLCWSGFWARYLWHALFYPFRLLRRWAVRVPRIRSITNR